MTDINFSITPAADRFVFDAGGQSIRHLVIRLAATGKVSRQRGDRAPVNIAAVIDASGSMCGERLSAAKHAARGLVRKLSYGDRFSLVTFASEVVLHLDAVKVSPKNRQRIEREIGAIECRDTTNLSEGWFKGVDCVARMAEMFPELTPRVLLLSDGHANEGITDVEELCKHAAELRKRGVLTSAVGIGDGYDEALLHGIAVNGGGRMHDAELTADMQSAMQGELSDILDNLIEDARINFEVPPGFEVEPVGEAATTVTDGRCETSIGPIQDGRERHAVFRLTCPKASDGTEFTFGFSAHGIAAGSRDPVTANPARVSLISGGPQDNSSQVRDSDMAGIVARHWFASILATTSRLNRDFDLEDSAAHARQELHDFKRYVRGLPNVQGMIDELEFLADQAGEEFSSRINKELLMEAAMVSRASVRHRDTDRASWQERLSGSDADEDLH